MSDSCFELEGWDEFVERFSQFVDKWEAKKAQLLKKMGNIYHSEVIPHVPVDTSHLVSNIFVFGEGLGLVDPAAPAAFISHRAEATLLFNGRLFPALSYRHPVFLGCRHFSFSRRIGFSRCFGLFRPFRRSGCSSVISVIVLHHSA